MSTDVLEKLIFDGYATKDFDYFDSKLTFTLKTLIGDEQLEIEKEMADVTGTTNRILHVYSLKMLSHALLKYGKEDLTKLTAEQRYKFLTNLSNVLIDKLINAQTEFERECKDLVSPESIENFSKTPAENIKSN
ncbi:MAG: hypothetical protein ACW98F_00115 [Candidatus Hodarchaeales archaeon]|jgi:hypothetical protein